MMTSNELLSTRSPSLFVSRQTPFDNGSIPAGQLFYFAPQCIQSGLHKEVTWSVLARDLVYSMSNGGGQPLLSLIRAGVSSLVWMKNHAPGWQQKYK